MPLRQQTKRETLKAKMRPVYERTAHRLARERVQRLVSRGLL